MKRVTSCQATTRGNRINLLIQKGEKGYKAFAKVLQAFEKQGIASWYYGDVTDCEGKETSGLVIAAIQWKRGKRKVKA